MALTILPYNDRSPVKSKQKAEAFSQAIQGGAEAYGKYQEDKALKEKYGIDLAGIRDPDTRSQIIAQELASGRKRSQAKQGQDINYFPGNEESPVPDVKTTKQPLPEFGEVGGKKTNKVPQQISAQPEGMGSVPQAETQGVKRPLLAPDQIMNQAKQISQMSMDTANPIDPNTAYGILNEKNEDNRRYNAAVDLDLAKRIESQDRYGNIAVQTLANVLPDATDEQQAIFRKKGEEASKTGESEAEIKRTLAIDARNFKNTLANIKKSIGPKRLLSSVKGEILGTSRPEEKEQTAIKIKLKPLLEEGLYGTARNLLSELGYHPEERESLIAELPEGTRKIMATFPKLDREKKSAFMPGFTNPGAQAEYTPDQTREIEDAVSKVFKTDPSTNLILLRKAMEDKNVDWVAYKDALDKGILEGSIKLNDDQFSQLDKMDEPPLDRLDKILYNSGLIGR